MTAFLLQLGMTLLTFVSFLAASGLSSWQPDAPGVSQEATDVLCLPCELFFRKLERVEQNGKLGRNLKVQLRGEPKSGTGIMFDWATAAMMRACDHLQLLYGEGSCLVDVVPGPVKPGHRLHAPVIQRMVFEPALGASEARCPCETIESVSIILSQVNKHTLPVSSASCAFSHNQGMDLGVLQKTNKKSACKFADGTVASNSEEMWRCMHEANCEITDDSLQMIIYRDPRPAVVSAFYHLRTYSNKQTGDIQDFVARELPTLCQWLVVRHILFSGILRQQSIEFWYDEAMADPLEWYYHWFDSVGLQLPYSVVRDAAEAAAADDLGFRQKRIEIHRGEPARNYTGVRKFKDEVSPETLKTADAVLRVWLPPILLEKLEVEPDS